MRKNLDRLEGITWYYDKSSPKYLNSRTAILLYFGKRESGSPWLRLRLQYAADDWLFIRNVSIYVDGRKFDPTWSSWEIDHGGGDIWEWYDVSPASSDLSIITQILNSKEATIRFRGDQYHKDRTISASDKAALYRVLVAFHALGGGKHY